MPWSDERVNDLFVFRTDAHWFLDGLLPYRNVLFGAAAMTKGFPLVVAPVALAWLGGRAALRGAVALVAVVAVLVGAAVALSPSGALDAVRYQTDRPVQVESLPALVVRAVDRH